jgi:galactonate dehydratase
VIVKVVSMETVVVGTPWRELTFVELVTDDGLRGVGEARMVNKTDTLLACIREIGERYVIGMDPFDVERLAWQVQWEEYGRVGEVTATALAIFDIACHDLMGQALEEPVWRLLGGRVRERVPAYANGWYQGDRDPEIVAELARRVVERGYRGLKIDPFGAAAHELDRSQLRTATSILAAVRDAIGPDIALMVEMHGRFSSGAAALVAATVEPYEPEWIEEPVPPYNPAGLRRIREHSNVAVASGERIHVFSEFRELFEQGLIDVVQADLTHCGGFTAMRKLAGWTQAYDLMLAPHNVCGPVGTAANVHFAIATNNYKVLEHFNDFADPWVATLVEGAPRVDETDGCFGLPTAPGLGVTLDHDACAARPRTGAHFNLVRPGWERRDLPATESSGGSASV